MENQQDICNKPFVSVLMSVFNETLKELKDSINSILNQTYTNLELIIVDDNPKNENILALLNEYINKNSNIVVIINEKNIGLAKSLNKAIDIAKGSILARMDADDVSVLNRIEKEVNLLLDKNYDMVTSNCDYIDDSGKIVGYRYDLPTNSDYIKSLLPYGNFICHPSVIMKKSVVNELGGYRSFCVSQDYDLWLRFISAGYIIGSTNEILLHYRIRQNSISSKNMIRRIVYIDYQKRLYKERMRIGKDSYTDDSVIRLENIIYKYSADKNIVNLIENIQKSISERNAMNFIKCYILSVIRRNKIILLWMNDLIKYSLIKNIKR